VWVALAHDVHGVVCPPVLVGECVPLGCPPRGCGGLPHLWRPPQIGAPRVVRPPFVARLPRVGWAPGAPNRGAPPSFWPLGILRLRLAWSSPKSSPRDLGYWETPGFKPWALKNTGFLTRNLWPSLITSTQLLNSLLKVFSWNLIIINPLTAESIPGKIEYLHKHLLNLSLTPHYSNLQLTDLDT